MSVDPSFLRTTLASLPPEDRQQAISGMSDEEAQQVIYDWLVWARNEQLPPPDDPIRWYIWLILSGRGWGKTRTGAEWVRARVESGQAKQIALVGETAADARDVMIEGDSGLLSISPPWCKPEYIPSRRVIIWPNGARAHTYSGDDPEQLRGPQHDTAWVDELAKFRYDSAWDNLMFGLRLGDDPRAAVTTTPRPTKLIRDLVKNPRCVVTGGSTYDNIENLAQVFIEDIIRKYEGTRLGKQELYAVLLEDNPEALWQPSLLDKNRRNAYPELGRIVIAVDPSGSEDGAETGIVAIGKGLVDRHGYVLEDASISGSPDVWGKQVRTTYDKWHADIIVAEKNYGGDMVASTINTRGRNMPIKLVTASRGKLIRAEPVAALDEQGRIHHVGYFEKLEEQMCTWMNGQKSPDRMDARVWGITELMLGNRRDFSTGSAGVAPGVMTDPLQRAEAEARTRFDIGVREIGVPGTADWERLFKPIAVPRRYRRW